MYKNLFSGKKGEKCAKKRFFGKKTPYNLFL